MIRNKLRVRSSQNYDSEDDTAESGNLNNNFPQPSKNSNLTTEAEPPNPGSDEPLMLAYTRHPTEMVLETEDSRDRRNKVVIPKAVFIVMVAILLSSAISTGLLIALLVSNKSSATANQAFQHDHNSHVSSDSGNGKSPVSNVPWTSGDKWSVTETTEGKRHAPGELLFSDEFDDFDFDKWQHEISLGGGGNQEFQAYMNTRRNSYVKDGRLYIKPTLTSDVYGEAFLTQGELDVDGGTPADRCTNPVNNGCKRRGTPTDIINPVISARVQTAKSFAFKYGKVEVSAKLPRGDWLWPAIWLLPLHNEYGTWPSSGEIDIMEGRGNLNFRINNNSTNIGVDQIGSTLHYGPAPDINGWAAAHTTVNRPDESFDKSFHKYTLQWTPDEFVYFLDDKEYFRINNTDEGMWGRGGFGNDRRRPENPWRYSKNKKMAPFDKKFFLIINLAVGGSNGYFPDDAWNPKPKPWRNNAPYARLDFWKAKDDWYPTWVDEDSALQIDYVRIYALD